MRLKKVVEYIGRSHKELKKISQKENINILYLWYDFIKCSLIHGAILNHYCRGGLYKLKGCERKKSMTYGRILKLFKKCNDPESITLLNSKHLFNKHFTPFIKREWLYSKDMTFQDFCELCKSNSILIVKPEEGVEGKGIYKLNTSVDSDWMQSKYEELLSGEYMIEEIIEQHPNMIYGNTSVNTIRVHSILDRTGEVHILKCLLRAGVGDSVVDNYANGGCVYELDVNSGRIVSPSLMKSGEEVFIHPGTEIFVLGRKVPNWEKVVSGIKKAHKMLPGCRFIGWDVAITNEEIELIEGNHNPDYELLEFFGSKGWYEKIKEFV